jgi:hypothetical protein
VSSTTRLRPKSFELEKVTTGRSKPKTEQGSSASTSPDVRRMQGYPASSPTVARGREGAERDASKGDGDGDDGEWVVFNMLDDDGEKDTLP